MGELVFKLRFSDHASFLEEKHSCPHSFLLWAVWCGPACLLSLSYCINRGPCKPSKVPWNSTWLPGMMECVSLQTSCSHTAPAFTGDLASAFDLHNHPVDDGRSQIHSMQKIPRAGCWGIGQGDGGWGSQALGPSSSSTDQQVEG